MRSAAQKKIVLRIGLPVKPAADLTARLTDRQANGVADATVVSVTAEGGQIVLCCVVLCCTSAPVLGISLFLVDVICQYPPPAGGWVSVLAYTDGIKDYVGCEQQ